MHKFTFLYKIQKLRLIYNSKMKRSITLVFSGRRGGGLTDLKNIIKGYISRNNYNIKIISLRHFESIDDIVRDTDIEYKSISKNCDSITKEFLLIYDT